MITSEEAKQDLQNYNRWMVENTELYLYQLIAIEEKYFCYGLPPQKVAEEISSYINQPPNNEDCFNVETWSDDKKKVVAAYFLEQKAEQLSNND